MAITSLRVPPVVTRNGPRGDVVPRSTFNCGQWSCPTCTKYSPIFSDTVKYSMRIFDRLSIGYSADIHSIFYEYSNPEREYKNIQRIS
eukprot:1180177-Prorocentrum_minimum.AAC.4